MGAAVTIVAPPVPRPELPIPKDTWKMSKQSFLDI